MSSLKAGPLTRAELQAVWEGASDAGYSAPLVTAGEGRGFEVWTQLFVQMERASRAIDTTTQALFISEWSGQTGDPAGGAERATVELTFARTKRLNEPLLLGAGYVWVDEETTDAGDGGPETVQTGRRYVLMTDLYFPPGEPGPLAVMAEAQFEGYGFNNPLPGTLVAIEQPGTGFNNDLATVTVFEAVAEPPAGVRSSALVIAANQADMFVPDHVGQYMAFTDGDNLARDAVRMVRFVSPDASLAIGSSIELELLYAVTASTFAGTFVTGEMVNIASGGAYGRIVDERESGGIKRIAVVMLTGPAASLTTAGNAIEGMSSGATATVLSVEHDSDFVGESETAAWRVLDWVTDYGLAVSNVLGPAGGQVAFLDELGDERGVGRSPGELDEDYRARVREIADVVSPNAVKRAMNRGFSYEWTLREVGSANLPGFFFDAEDAYDVDVLVFTGTLTGTFEQDEGVVLENPTTFERFADGRFGRLDAGDTSFVLVRHSGSMPSSVVGRRLRGLSSGATFAVTAGSTPPAAADRRFHIWLDYEQFRGFFAVEVEPLSLGEFGWSYDDTDQLNAYDMLPSVSLAMDGYPAAAADLYRRIYESVSAIKAGGVEFELWKGLPPTGPTLPPEVLSVTPSSGPETG